MREKWILPADERTTIAVDKEVHIFMKAYAREKGISLAEAVFKLIGIGLAQEVAPGLDSDEERT